MKNNYQNIATQPEQNETFYLITDYSENGYVNGITWEEAYANGLAECSYLCEQQM
ncbi:hypothetical protein [Sporosarcina sp. PTS2304]|uniref:hypothetical protein n=1 Tax=Sporosarcina sp. PTS2304 TaxID=2283194 RepID=UPI0013B359E2|nr:hypothetical protein [Sporosarcina sp. PTS2304]